MDNCQQCNILHIRTGRVRISTVKATFMKIIFTILALALTMNAHADWTDWALDNFSREASECSAYYFFTSTAPTLNKDIAKKLTVHSKVMRLNAIATSSEEVTKDRLELALKTIKREMENDWSNVSIINNKYQNHCNAFVNNPTGRFKHWADKSP